MMIPFRQMHTSSRGLGRGLTRCPRVILASERGGGEGPHLLLQVVESSWADVHRELPERGKSWQVLKLENNRNGVTWISCRLHKFYQNFMSQCISWAMKHTNSTHHKRTKFWDLMKFKRVLSFRTCFDLLCYNRIQELKCIYALSEQTLTVSDIARTSRVLCTNIINQTY